MKLHSFLIIFVLIIFACSCRTDNTLTYNDDDEFNFEVQILDEIFLDLTKAMNVKYGFPKHPPPPPPLKDNKGKIIGYDSTLYYQRIQKYQIDTANFKIKEKSALLAVSDTMSRMRHEDSEIRNHVPDKDYLSVFKYGISQYKLNRKIPIDSIHKTGHFFLKYSSKFHSSDKDLTKYYFNLYKAGGYGVFHVSRIHFNQTKTLGIFECGYYIASLNAHGGFVFIRKIDGKWQVEQYKMCWIS